MEPKWEEAVLMVLTDENKDLHYKEIYRTIANKKIRGIGGKTPETTVAKICSNLVKSNQARRVKRGVYRINQDGAESSQQEIDAASEDVEQAEQAEKYPSRSYGLLWRRNAVRWISYRGQNRDWNHGLRGQEHKNGEPRDFSEHSGIYILYHHGRVVYVGQAKELYARLSEHTSDRTSDRWETFSWFGLGEVGTANQSDEPMSDLSAKTTIDLLEAVLIEAILPPLNNKRGNNLGTQYMQYRS